MTTLQDSCTIRIGACNMQVAPSWLLATCHLTASMSREGNGYENAMAESFFATLNTESFATTVASTKHQTKRQLLD